MSRIGANPYASPAEESALVSAETFQHRGTPGQIAAWVGAALFNLPVPVFLGSLIVEDHFAAIAGMATGVLLAIVAGAIVVWMRPHIGRIATRGGYLFALTQIMPIPQVFAGMAAVTAAAQIYPAAGNFDNGPEIPGFGAAIIATLITAVLLIAVAVVLGLTLKGVTPRSWWPALGQPE